MTVVTAHWRLDAHPTRDQAAAAANARQRQAWQPWRVWQCLACCGAWHAAPRDAAPGPDTTRERLARQRAVLATAPHRSDPRPRVTAGGAEYLDVDAIAVERWVGGDRSVALNYLERIEAARRALALGWTENQVLLALRVNGTTWRKLRVHVLAGDEAAA